MEAGFCRTARHVPAPLAEVGGAFPRPKLPQKPRQPKRVQDPGADSVRQANYNAELAAWEAAKLGHEKKMQKRQAKQRRQRGKQREKASQKKKPSPGPLAPPPQLTAPGVTAFAMAPHSA